MAKSEPDAKSAPRKRQLNVIYFVDSARTRSFALPLTRLNVLLFLALGVVAWSVVSVLLIAWLTKDREEVASRLRQSLATVFEYEARHDNAYDIAYPPAGKTPPTKVVAATKEPAAAHPTPQPMPAAEQPKEAPTGAVADASSSEPDAPSDEEGDVDSKLTVSNPVLTAGKNSLQLEFDLTNRENDRAEGFVWAVAEFKTDEGEQIFIGAPKEIDVQADGEPKQPTKSASFNIRRFKKKGFSFPFVKGKNGTFVGVKIGVMNRSGEEKSTYRVPVEIRVGKSNAEGEGEGDKPEAKSG